MRIMRTLATALLFALLSLPSGAQTSSRMYVPDSPESVVQAYCQFDFEGARTRGETYDRLSKLVLWHTEPGWDQSFAVRNFQIVSAKKDNTRAAVTVEYRLVGHIDGGEFTSTPRSERVTFLLKRSSKEWVWRHEEPVLVKGKLAWRITQPIIPPHISVAYAIKHFESIIGNPPNEYDQQLKVTVKKLKESQRGR
jgi:hypothetical protein